MKKRKKIRYWTNRGVTHQRKGEEWRTLCGITIEAKLRPKQRFKNRRQITCIGCLAVLDAPPERVTFDEFL